MMNDAKRRISIVGAFFDDELDAAIALSTIVRGVVGDGSLRTEACRRESWCVDSAFVDEVIEHGFRAICRQLLVESIRPTIVGVSFDREQLDVRVDLLGPGLVPGLKLLDQIGLDAADEADLAALGLHGRRGAHQVAALLLGEDQLLDVFGLGLVLGRIGAVADELFPSFNAYYL